MLKLPQFLVKCKLNNINAVRYLRKMPGINKTQKLVSQPGEQFNPEELDELEADFNALDMSYKNHLEENEKFKEQEKLHIVKQKYFKENYPNFLTWADKLQIKFLHNQDPEEWTIDKLAEGFPALPATIKKILKGNWTLNNVNKIKSHDNSVCTNWDNFKTGKLDLPEGLTEHLNKFTNRSLNFNYSDYSMELKPSTPMATGEFSAIIESYEELKSKQNLHDNKLLEDKTVFNNKHVDKTRPLEETYTMEKKENYKLKSTITLGALEKYLGKKITKGEELSTDEKLILSSPFNKLETKTKEIELKVAKYVDKKGQVGIYDRNKKDYSHLNYPEKIDMPRKLRYKGDLYKLNDCYYDKGGYFLYRVPGME